MPAFAKLLLIETSSRAGEIALGTETGRVRSQHLASGKRNASDLASIVDLLLKEENWQARELTGVACSLGPGSFTSLRVGLMSAKTLSFVLGCPLFGVPTFQIIRQQCSRPVSKLWVISDALQGMVYSQAFGSDGTESESLAIRPLSELLEAESCFTGPGVNGYRNRFADDSKLIDASEREPKCETMRKMVMDHGERFRVDPYVVEPIYLRGSSAEEKRKSLRNG
jgi:tRNA threonylcarbamoyladenosine biosynthesis protein TsaB